jgi:hypothetical protein
VTSETSVFTSDQLSRAARDTCRCARDFSGPLSFSSCATGYGRGLGPRVGGPRCERRRRARILARSQAGSRTSATPCYIQRHEGGLNHDSSSGAMYACLVVQARRLRDPFERQFAHQRRCRPWSSDPQPAQLAGDRAAWAASRWSRLLVSVGAAIFGSRFWVRFRASSSATECARWSVSVRARPLRR